MRPPFPRAAINHGVPVAGKSGRAHFSFAKRHHRVVNIHRLGSWEKEPRAQCDGQHGGNRPRQCFPCGGGQRNSLGRRRRTLWRSFTDPFQLQPNVPRGLKTVVGVFLQARFHYALERWRCERLNRRNRLRIFFQNRAGHADLAFPVKRPPARDRFIEHRAQRKNIRPRIRFLAFQLLGRHVLNRAQYLARGRKRRDRTDSADRLRRGKQGSRGAIGRHSGQRSLRQAEIHQLRAAFRQHDVARLQIAMNDPRPMRGIERLAHFHADPHGLLQRNRTAPQPVGQRFALEILHHQKIDALLVAHVIQRADTRMIQRRNRARLAVESLSQLWVRGKMLRQDLDGHFAAQPRVAGAIHFAHTARSQRGHNLVRSKFCPGNKCHERGIITWKRPYPPQFDRFRPRQSIARTRRTLC